MKSEEWSTNKNVLIQLCIHNLDIWKNCYYQSKSESESDVEERLFSISV